MSTFKSAPSLDGNKITNVGDPTAAQDAATKSWVETAIAGVPGGLDTEGVQDIVGGMVTLNTETGITVTYEDVDGTLDFVVNDSPLLGGQNSTYHLDRANHTGTQALGTLTGHDKAAHDALLIDAATLATYTAANLRDRSTHTGTQALGTLTGHDKAAHDALGIDAATLEGNTAAQLQSTITAAIVDTAPGTLDTLNELAAALNDDPAFATTVNTALGLRVLSYDTLIGDGTTTALVVTHNLNTRKVIVAVYDAVTYAEIVVDTVRTTVNTVTVNFTTAPATNAYVCVVQGVLNA